ncbi:endonuclease III domain-containing protein [Blattabacterium cuenoti]|uniref:endonuclease III domain-containing protein n=1 Tax=Blattabacterium cuenoti TaxID=1653831 RepID=UPI001EEBB896|nr:endonuclease III [Blattabacterium cuenoti]
MLTSRSKEKKVNEITRSLFKRIKKPHDVIFFSLNEMKNFIRKIGLFNKKAKNIYNLSILLIEKHDGNVPKCMNKLKDLPGIGRKTASVFLSHVSEYPVFPIDTHIHRMMFRWELSNGKNVKKTEKDAKFIFSKKNWKKLHLQIIFYGREYSPSRKWNLKRDIIYQKLVNNNLLKKNYQKGKSSKSSGVKEDDIVEEAF